MSDHHSSDTPVNNLTQLRVHLDQIDQKLHHLLMQRAEIVRNVAATKGNAPILRPGREAQILRNLIKTHQGPMPVAFVLNMWREMLRGMSYLQRPLKVTAYAPQDDLRYYHLARDYFGQNIPLKPGRSLMETLSAISMGTDMIVMPTPQQDEEFPWWSQISSGLTSPTHDTHPYVIACLPFYPHVQIEQKTKSQTNASAFVLGHAPDDPSGDDHSIFIIECSQECDQERLDTLFSEKGIQILECHQCQAHYDPDMTQNFLRLKGYYTDASPEISDLRIDAKGLIEMIHYFGNYPVSLKI